MTDEISSGNRYWDKLSNSYQLDLASGSKIPLTSSDAEKFLSKLFDENHRTEIEIGCGKGRFLLEAAKLNPEIRYIGIERSSKYIQRSRERLSKHKIETVRLIQSEALHFVENYVPDRRLHAYHIYFPDPWPKKRHHKRRLFSNKKWIDEMLRTLAANGKVQIATDHFEYFSEITEKLNLVSDFTYLDEESSGESPIQTNFEIKYRAEGRKIFRAVYEVKK